MLQSSDFIIHFHERPYKDRKHERRRYDHQQRLLALALKGITAEYGKNEYEKQAGYKNSKKSHGMVPFTL